MRYISNLPLLISGAVLLLFVAVLAFSTVRPVYAAGEEAQKNGEKLLVVHDENTERGFLTKAATVQDALKEAGIPITDNDLVEPSLDEELVANSYDINIYRARPVVIIDGAVRKKIMSAYRTPAQIVKHAGIEFRDEDKTSIDLPIGGAMQLTITRATGVNLVLYGKKTTVYTHQKTVGDLLEEKGISLGKDDALSIDKNASISADMVIELWREGKQTITEEEDVAFKVEQIQDVDREVGYREIKTPGEAGRRTVTYEVEMRNGIEVSRREIQSVTTKEPKTQVEVVGVKNNYSSSLDEWLTALRTCETGGTYNRNSGNGYYGAYQFLPSTWDSIARRTGRLDLVGVRPDLATPADQDAMVIANTNATAGLVTQHPGCYKKLGLSNKPPAS